MATRFCNRCGAPIIEGNRFCIKCGQPLAQAPPRPLDPTAAPIPKTTPPKAAPGLLHTGSLEPPKPMLAPPVPPAPARPAPKRNLAGLVIGLVAVVLILAAAGFWFYLHQPAKTSVAASVPAADVPPPPTPVTTAPEPAATIPSPGAPVEPSSTPAPSAVVPSTPRTMRKPVAPATAAPKSAESAPASAPVQIPAPPSAPAAAPVPRVPAPAARPASGVLHYTGPPVPQNGEVVFENLPAARLRFTFDRGAWQPVISRQPDGTQKLTLRSLKPGLQTQCDVGWEIIQ